MQLIQISVWLIMSKAFILHAVEVEEAHEEFNSTMYEKATEIFSSRFKELTSSEIEEFSFLINKLNKKMANLSSEILGTDITLSGNLSLANIVEAAGPSGPQMDQLRRGVVDYQQKYVEQVIKTFSLEPEELGLTSEEFCEIFGICPTSPISSSTPPTSTTSSSKTAKVVGIISRLENQIMENKHAFQEYRDWMEKRINQLEIMEVKHAFQEYRDWMEKRINQLEATTSNMGTQLELQALAITYLRDAMNLAHQAEKPVL